jgi:hypothetical protein
MTHDVTPGRIVSTTLCTQGNGFTCGIDDVILNPEAEAKRAKVLTGADATALRASAEAAGLPSLKVSVLPFNPSIRVATTRAMSRSPGAPKCRNLEQIVAVCGMQ